MSEALVLTGISVGVLIDVGKCNVVLMAWGPD
jgi:hypothetical protein